VVLRAGSGGTDTVVVPKGQATPDHTISIMSSGTGSDGFGQRNRTAAVASVTEVGRLFLRDISLSRRYSLREGRMLTRPSVPFGRLEGACPARRLDVELTIARELLVFALLIASVLGVMWILSATRRSPR